MTRRPAILLLQDGTLFEGSAIGENETGYTVGEAVFNTSMTGYQEVVTDPSYSGQLVTFTYPHIGNYGANLFDVEGPKIAAAGLICRELVSMMSNQRATMTFADFLARENVIGIEGVDTRRLAIHLREKGVQMAIIAHNATAEDRAKYAQILEESTPYGSIDFCAQVVQEAPQVVRLADNDSEQNVSTINNFGATELVFESVSQSSEDVADSSKPHVVVVDYGTKYSIYRSLLERGVRVTAVPYTESLETIDALKPDGILISNGPGDPSKISEADLEKVRKLASNYPTFGICLGHQLLSRAFGGETFKLPFGHRGPNQPVLVKETGVVMMTSQNHGYAVRADKLPDGFEVTSINLNDETVSGLKHTTLPILSVQYHPEAGPGPNDAKVDFDKFLGMLK